MSGVLTHTAQKRLFHEIEVYDVGREIAELTRSYEWSKANLDLLAVKLTRKPSGKIADTNVRVGNHLILDFGVQLAVVGNDLILEIQFIGHHRPNGNWRNLLENHARNDSVLVDFDLTLLLVRGMSKVETLDG